MKKPPHIKIELPKFKSGGKNMYLVNYQIPKNQLNLLLQTNI